MCSRTSSIQISTGLNFLNLIGDLISGNLTFCWWRSSIISSFRLSFCSWSSCMSFKAYNRQQTDTLNQSLTTQLIYDFFLQHVQYKYLLTAKIHGSNDSLWAPWFENSLRHTDVLQQLKLKNVSVPPSIWWRGWSRCYTWDNQAVTHVSISGR